MKLFSELTIFGSSKEAPTKQSISESRQKLHYQAFAYLLNKANMEEHIEPLWHGHRVRIVDGTKINGPNTTELKEHFDIPNTKFGSGLFSTSMACDCYEFSQWSTCSCRSGLLSSL